MTTLPTKLVLGISTVADGLGGHYPKSHYEDSEGGSVQDANTTRRTQCLQVWRMLWSLR